VKGGDLYGAMRNSWIVQIDTALLVLVSILILVNCFRFHPEIRIRKALFLTRIWFYPLIFYSNWAIFAAAANHGIEYFFTAKKMLDESEIDKPKKKRLISTAIGVCVLWMAATAPHYSAIYGLQNIQKQGSFAVVLFFELFVAMEFTHYWMDRVLYRMRDPSARLNQGQLLIR
jgi:hypothetical protein